MKKTLTILAVLLWTSLALNAQQGEIITTEFDPPLLIQGDDEGGDYME